MVLRIITRPIQLLLSVSTWAAAVFLLLSFGLGLFWFIVLVTLVSTGAGMAITLVGLPLLLFTMVLWTYGARVERWRVAVLLGVSIPSPYRSWPASPWLSRLRAFVMDPAVWRDVLYLVLLFPIGVAEFVILVVAVSVPLGALTLPLYVWAIPSEAAPNIGSVRFDTVPEALALAAIGVPLLLLMPYVLRGVAKGHAMLARALLGPGQADLAARVDQLGSSRTRVLDEALRERRRIERDLHDGIQQQLTALALDLGMAREKLEVDEAGGAALVAKAHEESKAALAGLRDLIRGISPAILADRGLDAAVSALAARCPVPVELDIDLPRRLPEVVETTAYFVVAESLTNIARHSGATEARVSARMVDRDVVVEVWDNGGGSAQPRPGSGLAGLADRAAGLDGRLIVDSPPGGPTLVCAELPCGS